MRTKPARFPVFHVPHDGDAFPEELMESVCIPREEFLLIHAQMRDVGVRELVPLRRRKRLRPDFRHAGISQKSLLRRPGNP